MKRLACLSLLTLAGCGSTVVSIPPASCAKLIPENWREGVEAAPIPTDAPVTSGTPLTEAVRAAIIAPWASAYVLMSARLEESGGRTADTIAIFENCEKLVNEARP